MDERTFVIQAGWGAARRDDLAGDASTRRYARLRLPDRTAILMTDDDAANIDAFLRVGAHLAALGLCTPNPLARSGPWLLMDDLGDRDMAAVIAENPQTERRLYEIATDVLVRLQSAPAPHWTVRYDPARMADYVEPAFRHYASDPSGFALVRPILHDLLDRHAPQTDVLLHRDYHAQNLIWRADRPGLAAIGLLDYQDALAGHAAYDLASLLQDARRDVPPSIEAAMIARFTQARDLDPDDFGRAYAVQAAQRHLRILGIFARLAHLGKPGYGALQPRGWAHLQRVLTHPELTDLRDAVARTLQAPGA